MMTVRKPSRDPFYNQAFEEVVFERFADDDVFFLWQNDPAVVVGSYQNICREVHVPSLRRMGVPVVRRSSGGGTVYHDGGNVNYTYITRSDGQVDYDRCLSPVIDALNRIGLGQDHLGVVRVGHGDGVGLGIQHVDEGVEQHHVLALIGVQADHLRLALVVAGVVDGAFLAVAVARAVFLQRQIVAGGGLEQQRLLHAVVELLVLHAAVLYEGMDVVPVALVVLALVVELAGEAIGHLAGDVGGHLLDVAVVLQERAGDVQRQIRAVDHALEQQQEFRNDFLNIVRHEHLIVVELDHALAGGELVLDLREVQDALEVEGVLRVQMDPEQRLLVIVEHLVIERAVFLVGAVGGALEPERADVVDLLGLLLALGFRLVRRIALGALVLLFLGRLDLAQEDRHGHEGAVFVQHASDGVFFEEFLFVVAQMQRDAGAHVRLVRCGQLVTHAVLAAPVDALRALLPAHRIDLHLGGHHERRIEAQAEMADDAAVFAFLALILLEEFLRAGKRDLTDILDDLVLGHADAVIDDFQRGGGLVDDHVHAVIVARGRFALEREQLILGDRVAAVGHNLAQENILVGIKPLLDDGHYILSINRNRSLFTHGKHLLIRCYLYCSTPDSKCQ